MITIKLNDYECQIDNYNRNTSISEGNFSSNGYASIVNGDVNELNALLGTSITSIEIYSNEEKIYDLKNISAEINSINEYLSGERIAYNVSMIFRQSNNEEI